MEVIFDTTRAVNDRVRRVLLTRDSSTTADDVLIIDYGRVINSTSTGVLAPIANLGLSNALRSSLVGWSKTLAREVARDGVTANIVVPGRVATGRTLFLDQARATRENRTVESVVAESTAAIPAGRYGTPEEYAGVVAFLASARASYITGSMIRVDGGLIAGI
ncbi:MAG: SDR family oxidoreductase [Akkermansiaceae bacterium]|nr:SDR family oxidoreductase [Verrucomicrobiales bacterium]